MFNSIIRTLINIVLKMPNSPFKKVVRDIFYGEVFSERIVEYSIVLANLNLKPSKWVKILDIGCYYSNFPIQLASMGFSVTGVDLMDYELTHPNFKFIKGDIILTPLPPKAFDLATCISTLEHIGLAYYDNKKDLLADKKVVEVVHSILKKKGLFLITVPFGKKSITPSYKSYDLSQVKNLFKSNFEIKKMEFFHKINNKWLHTDLKSMKSVDNRHEARGVVFIAAINK